MSLWEYVGPIVVLIAVVFFLAFYAWVYLRNKALGSPGIRSRARVTCSKCHRSFDYDFVPGASFTALRLGGSRYMACPLCHRWGLFDLSDRKAAPPRAAR